MDAIHIAAESRFANALRSLPCDRYPMAAPINIASPVEIVREGDLFATSLA